jgi:hypothetical protein
MDNDQKFFAGSLGLMLMATVMTTLDYSGLNTGAPTVVDLSACGTYTANNTIYNLTTNLTNGTSNCLLFTGTNVTLECNGYTINMTGASDAAVYQSTNTYFVIQNCVLVTNQTTGYGIRGTGSSGRFEFNVTNTSISAPTLLMYLNGFNTNAPIFTFRNITTSGGGQIVLASSVAGVAGPPIYVLDSNLTSTAGVFGVSDADIASFSFIINNSILSMSNHSIFSADDEVLRNFTVINSNFTCTGDYTACRLLIRPSATDSYPASIRDSIFTNIGLNITSGSTNLKMARNRFTANPAINITTCTNCNITELVAGVYQGNYYPNISQYAIYDRDGDGYGDIGRQYPANSSNTPFITDATGKRWADLGPMVDPDTVYTGYRVTPITRINESLTDDFGSGGTPDRAYTWDSTTNVTDFTDRVTGEVFWTNTSAAYIKNITRTGPVIECFQETATMATACGGLATGAYACSDGWDATDTCAKAYDGTTTTWGHADTGVIAHFNITYTKPVGVESAVWQASEVTLTNITIPEDCWNVSTTNITFQVESLYPTGTNDAHFNCWNGTGFEQLYVSTDSASVREEAIYWNITNTSTIATKHVELKDSELTTVKQFSNSTVFFNYFSLVNTSTCLLKKNGNVVLTLPAAENFTAVTYANATTTNGSYTFNGSADGCAFDDIAIYQNVTSDYATRRNYQFSFDTRPPMGIESNATQLFPNGEVTINWYLNNTLNTTSPVAAAYYSFYNASAFDDSIVGRSSNLSVTNATWSSYGIYGGAYTFNGSQFIKLPNGYLDTVSDRNFTICAWVKSNGDQTNRFVVARIGNKTGINITNNYVSFSVYNNTTTVANAQIGCTSPDSTIIYGQWQYICGRASNTSKTVDLTVDGVQVCNNTFNGSLRRFTTKNWGIGSNNTTVVNGFNGSIDEVRFYNDTLTNNEISDLRLFNTPNFQFVVGADVRNGTVIKARVLVANNYAANSSNILLVYDNLIANFSSGITRISFQPISATSSNVAPVNQTGTLPLFNVTNGGSTVIPVLISHYPPLDGFLIKCSTGNSPYSAMALDATNQTIVNLTGGNNTGIWCWADFNAPPVTVYRYKVLLANGE